MNLFVFFTKRKFLTQKSHTDFTKLLTFGVIATHELRSFMARNSCMPGSDVHPYMHISTEQKEGT